MSLLAVLLLCATTYALPLRSELQAGELYPGYLHESSYDDSSKPIGRNLDSIGGGNLLRDLESGLLRSGGYLTPRAGRQYLDSLQGSVFGSSKRFDQESMGKRNGMDEIDRSGFNSFIKKKNFDEIDRSGFDGFVKRNFDEIDRSGFNGFVKRAAHNYPLKTI